MAADSDGHRVSRLFRTLMYNTAHVLYISDVQFSANTEPTQMHRLNVRVSYARNFMIAGPENRP